jgi:hypothetical protein
VLQQLQQNLAASVDFCAHRIDAIGCRQSPIRRRVAWRSEVSVIVPANKVPESVLAAFNTKNPTADYR